MSKFSDHSFFHWCNKQLRLWYLYIIVKDSSMFTIQVKNNAYSQTHNSSNGSQHTELKSTRSPKLWTRQFKWHSISGNLTAQMMGNPRVSC